MLLRGVCIFVCLGVDRFMCVFMYVCMSYFELCA